MKNAKYKIIERQKLDYKVIIYLIKATADQIFSEAIQSIYYLLRVQALGEKSILL